MNGSEHALDDTRQTRRTALILAFLGIGMVGVALGGWVSSGGGVSDGVDAIGQASGSSRLMLAGAAALLSVAALMVWRTRRQVVDSITHDPRTGLYRPGFVEESLRNQLALEDRQARAGVALVLVEIDQLSRLRDRYGQSAVSEVSALVGRQLRSQARAGDLPTQSGDGQFAVYLQCEELEQAEAFCRRVAMLLARDQLEVNGDVFKVAARMGVAVRQAGESLDGLQQRAQLQLRAARDRRAGSIAG